MSKRAHGAGSQVVAALESAWRQLQKITPDLPDVIIIIGSGATSGAWGWTAHGAWVEGRPGDLDQGASLTVHHETSRKTEVFMSGERLACGARLTLQTLAHEATHVLAKTRGIKDTSRQGRYHNREFAKLAKVYGLEYPADQGPTQIGFSAVELTDMARYADVLDRLDRAIRVYIPGLDIAALVGLTARLTRRGGGLGPLPVVGGWLSTPAPGTAAIPLPKRRKGVSATSLVKAVCNCERPRIIRIARSTLALAAIRCEACGEEFTEV